MRFKNNAGVKMPLPQRLEPGTYHYCMCGETKNVPFCDGAHKGTDILPQEFKVETHGTTVLCTCGLTQNPPRCDGNHKDF